MSNTARFNEELKTGLKGIFGKEVTQNGSSIRTHVDAIGKDQLHALSALVGEADVDVRLMRSGTGITILVQD